MAKRTRYPGRPATKPGAKRPGQGPAARPGASPAARPAAAGTRIGGLTEAEVERAAQIEKELLAREQAAIAENARRRARTSAHRVDVALTGDAGQPLSVRASHEYAYVARDVRRIVVTGSVMMGILALIWVAVNIGGIGAT
jgi:hypothetical protein